MILFEKEYSPKITEKDVKKQVRDYLRIRGWFVFPIMQGLGSYRGISDLIACKNGQVLFIECKAPGGQLSQYQKRFKESIEAAGCIYIVAWGYEDIEEVIEIKKITTWFKCEYPGCHKETDHGYEIEYEGKKIKVCQECYKKTRRKK